MRINPKSQKGAITLVVLVAMLFLTAFLMSMYVGIANKAKTSAETTKQISEQYNNLDQANTIYDSYFADSDVIPIYTREQLEKIGSGEQITVNGKVYTFSPNAYYTIQNDLDLGGYYNEATGIWSAEEEWVPLASTFTGVLDGLGNTITGLYINDAEASNQGLFGTLKGTVKNLKLYGSYINANEYVGGIAGKNEGTIENCYNKSTVIGTNHVGGIAGNLTENIVNCYNTGNIVGSTNVTGGYFKSITTGETIEVWSDNVLDENAYFVSGSYTATAPKGFKVSKNVFEQTIEDGMVVQDNKENEFVWVPVTVTASDTKTKIASFYRSEWANNKRSTNLMSSNTYKEPYASNTWEVTEYNNMVESVYNNKGFYIGRYEAGSEEERKISGANGTTKIIVKRDAYPYTMVGWGLNRSDYTRDVVYNNLNQGNGAVYLSKNMYPETSNVGVASTLCYGIQWEAVLDYVKDDAHNVTSSTAWGNYADNTKTITRTTAKYYDTANAKWVLIPTGGISKTFLLTTGGDDSFAAKNIFDLAGNTWEWTMEHDSLNASVLRGGFYGENGYDTSSSGRGTSAQNSCFFNFGFRPALYIK